MVGAGVVGGGVNLQVHVLQSTLCDGGHDWPIDGGQVQKHPYRNSPSAFLKAS